MLTAHPALADLSALLALSDRSELRLRDSGELAGQVVDLETSPAATLSLRSRAFRFSIAYLPRFTLRQVDYRPEPEVFQRGALSAALHGPRYELALDADLAYGATSFTSLVPIEGADPAHPQVDRLPQLSTIDYLSSRAGVTATFAVSDGIPPCVLGHDPEFAQRALSVYSSTHARYTCASSCRAARWSCATRTLAGASP